MSVDIEALFVVVGKFVTVKGTVVRVSCIKPLCVTMAYECINCQHIQVTYSILLSYYQLH